MKTPQVTPTWNTGIYCGDGVVANKPEGPSEKHPHPSVGRQSTGKRSNGQV